MWSAAMRLRSARTWLDRAVISTQEAEELPGGVEVDVGEEEGGRGGVSEVVKPSFGHASGGPRPRSATYSGGGGTKAAVHGLYSLPPIQFCCSQNVYVQCGEGWFRYWMRRVSRGARLGDTE